MDHSPQAAPSAQTVVERRCQTSHDPLLAVTTRRRADDIADVATARAALTMGWLPTLTPRSMLFFVVVAAAAIVEAAFYIGGFGEPIVAGRIPLPPSVFPLALLLLIGGDRLRGTARSRVSGIVFWLTLGSVWAVATVAVAEPRQLDTVFALMIAGLNEEVIYRFVVPAIAAFGLTKLHVSWPVARLAGFIIGGAWFLFLPGHVRQWASMADLVPFVAFSMLASLAVYRSGAVLEIGLVHGVMNLINIGRINGDIDATGAILLAALLGLLFVTYVPHSPARRVPEPDLVLDLADARLQARLAAG